MESAHVDARERRVLERALQELGYDPCGFDIAVSPVSRAADITALPRKVVVVSSSCGSSFCLETYATASWAGEVLVAVVEGKLHLPGSAIAALR